MACAGFVPIHSGGTARDLHPLPFTRKHLFCSVTLWELAEPCQVQICPFQAQAVVTPNANRAVTARLR